jgi:hypothetical protein
MNKGNNKRSHNPVSLSVKNEILEAHTLNKLSLRVLEKQFNIPKSTIQDILKNKEAIQSAITDGHDGKRARLRKAKEEDVEKALVMWIGNVRSQNVPLSGPLVMVNSQNFNLI